MATFDKNIIDKIRKYLDDYSEYSPTLFDKTVKELEKGPYDLSVRAIRVELPIELLDGDTIKIDELMLKLKELKDLGHKEIYRDSYEGYFYTYDQRKETIGEASHRILNDYFWPMYKSIGKKQAEIKDKEEKIKKLQEEIARLKNTK